MVTPSRVGAVALAVIAAVVRGDGSEQCGMHVLAHRDGTADVQVRAALQPVVAAQDDRGVEGLLSGRP